MKNFTTLSRAKEGDRKRRAEMLAGAVNALKLYTTADDFYKSHFYDSAKQFSRDAQKLKEKMATFDYSLIDRMDEFFLKRTIETLI